jgi:hypothetical protein
VFEQKAIRRDLSWRVLCFTAALHFVLAIYMGPLNFTDKLQLMRGCI